MRKKYGWLDGQTKYIEKKMDGWMDGWIKRKRKKDGWLDG